MCSMSSRPKAAPRVEAKAAEAIDWRAVWPLVVVATLVFALLVAAAVLRGATTPSPYQMPPLYSTN